MTLSNASGPSRTAPVGWSLKNSATIFRGESGRVDDEYADGRVQVDAIGRGLLQLCQYPLRVPFGIVA